jgi:hypothetical protein
MKNLLKSGLLVAAFFMVSCGDDTPHLTQEERLELNQKSMNFPERVSSKELQGDSIKQDQDTISFPQGISVSNGSLNKKEPKMSQELNSLKGGSIIVYD